MVYKEIEIKLKDGRNAILRSPSEYDAEEMLQFIKMASGETDFLMKFPEEYADFTIEQEEAFIRESYGISTTKDEKSVLSKRQKKIKNSVHTELTNLQQYQRQPREPLRR